MIDGPHGVRAVGVVVAADATAAHWQDDGMPLHEPPVIRDDGDALILRMRSLWFRNRRLAYWSLAATAFLIAAAAIRGSWDGAVLFALLGASILAPYRVRFNARRWTAEGQFRPRNWKNVAHIVQASRWTPTVTVELDSGHQVPTGLPPEWDTRLAEIAGKPLIADPPAPKPSPPGRKHAEPTIAERGTRLRADLARLRGEEPTP